jgi:hypothetical protein
VFYSGGPAAERAAVDWAKANGWDTINGTAVGRVLTKLTDMTDYKFVTKPLWEKASQGFAEGARGYAHVFLGPGAPSAISVYATVERPILSRVTFGTFQHFI